MSEFRGGTSSQGRRPRWLHVVQDIQGVCHCHAKEIQQEVGNRDVATWKTRSTEANTPSDEHPAFACRMSGRQKVLRQFVTSLAKTIRGVLTTDNGPARRGGPHAQGIGGFLREGAVGSRAAGHWPRSAGRNLRARAAGREPRPQAVVRCGSRSGPSRGPRAAGRGPPPVVLAPNGMLLGTGRY